jgi:2-polyprenyl-3-methyl-5-hydroxy-6-metoxy-1,4-benzoquinol methylase
MKSEVEEPNSGPSPGPSDEPGEGPRKGPLQEPRSEWLYDRRITTIAAETNRVESTPCPVCRNIEIDPKFAVEGIPQPIGICVGCGLGRYFPMLEREQIEAAYPPAYYGHAETKFRGFVELLVRFAARRHVDFLSADLARGAKVLDVGCGRGVLLGPLADRGFDVFGVEISESASLGVDPRTDVRVASRLGDAHFEAESFDQIIIWHVLEHIADPVHTIEESKRILRPGGRIIVAVPNFSSIQARWSGPAWFHLDAPRHLYHFPLHTLEKLLSDRGFEIQSTHHFSMRQNPFGWIQSALNRATRLPTNSLYRLMHQSGAEVRLPFSATTRLVLWAVLVLTAPLAIGLSVIASWLRSGATIHVVARRRP